MEDKRFFWIKLKTDFFQEDSFIHQAVPDDSKWRWKATKKDRRNDHSL